MIMIIVIRSEADDPLAKLNDQLGNLREARCSLLSLHDMYVYIYIYIYIYTYIDMCIYIYMYIHYVLY